MIYGFESSRNNEKYESFDSFDNTASDVGFSEFEETEDDFDDCELSEYTETSDSVVESEELEEAEDNFEDCEKELDSMEEENPELTKEEEDSFDDCEYSDEQEESDEKQQGQYVTEVECEVDSKTPDKEVAQEVQEAYDSCDDPEDMQQLKDNINENTDYEVVNAEVVERPEETDNEPMERAETKEEFEDRKKEYEEKKEESDDLKEELEKREKEAENHREETEDEKTGENQNEVQQHKKSLGERIDEMTEKEDVSLSEVRELRQENASELQVSLEEKEKLDKEFSEKFNSTVSIERGTEEYKQALQDYNDVKDRKEAIDDKVKALQKQQEVLEKKNQKLTDLQLEKGEEAIVASTVTLSNADELQQRFDSEYYSEHPDKNELSEIQLQNTETVNALSREQDSIKLAMDAKMEEMAEYITSNNMSRFESSQDLRYQQMANDYNRMQQAYEKNGYTIAKLETNNELIQDKLSEMQENPTIKDKLTSFFGGLNIFEETQQTAAEGAVEIEPETASENISVEEELSERFEKFKGRDVNDLTEEERQEFVNISIDNAIKKYGENLSVERIEKIKNGVSFVNTEYVARNTNAKHPENILGYYSPHNDEIKINLEAQSKTEDVIATIDHECLHMITQQVNEVTQDPCGVTGVKNLALSGGNVGMNEGITEMYSIRNMNEINRDYVSHSYTDQVEIMKEYESICGKDKLEYAYMNNDVDLLRHEFDEYSGEGSFDTFCNHMDKMHSDLVNDRYSNANYEKSIVNDMLRKYKEEKSKSEREIIGGIFN